MEANDKIKLLQAKGVQILSPEHIYIDDDVALEQIATGSCLYPFTRLHGAKTTIATGAQIGQESPASIINCCVGENVQLRGGFFSNSLFLNGVSVGSGAHIREGCLLEEEASCAHSVGLKQTILFPFVTLGSLINFCDCLMAGGTSRTNHSEVGSSYIHFNFTPHQDKATPSLLGDVAKGVMLNQSPIFLGGQGGLVGPARIDYGTIVAAGTIWRGDAPLAGGLISKANCDLIGEFQRGVYKGFSRIVINNIDYIANLIALMEWYRQVRGLFWQKKEYGKCFAQMAEDILEHAIAERILRLRGLCQKAVEGRDKATFLLNQEALRKQDELIAKIEEIAVFISGFQVAEDESGKEFIGSIATLATTGDYIGAIKGLDLETAEIGSKWLLGIVGQVRSGVFAIIPSVAWREL